MSKLWLRNRVIEEEVTETPANEAIFYFNYLLWPELALTRLQLAELLLEHYPQEKSETIAQLDFAIPEFRDIKMNTYLERALRHKEILKA
jgi:hypothetical protein